MTGSVPHPDIVESAPAGPAVTLRWPTEADTALFAQRLAAAPALHNAVIALRGDLGAGKTTLVRHLLRALGVRGRIKSPTYTVVEPYEVTLHGQPLAIWHFDCYRFADPREWEDAGFRDLCANPGLKLVEWPDKAAGALPPADLDIAIVVQADQARQVVLTAPSPAGQALARVAAMDSRQDVGGP